MTHAQILGKWFAVWSRSCKLYGRAIEPEDIPVYVELLRDLSLDDLEAACRQCAKTCSDFPAVADIRKAADELRTRKRETMRALNETPSLGQEECAHCGGSGWERVHYGTLHATRRCRCRQPGYQLPEPAPRNMLTAADRKEFATVLAGNGREL